MKERETKEGDIRTLYYSEEFIEFFDTLPPAVQNKYEHTMEIVEQVYAIPDKFVKKLQNTNLYEMRIAVGTNAYRTVLFSMNHKNLIQATEIVLLNTFLKKSEKDYRKAIAIAEQILEKLEL